MNVLGAHIIKKTVEGKNTKKKKHLNAHHALINESDMSRSVVNSQNSSR